jgi:beta-lactam-binding protein with PASTA domain
MTQAQATAAYSKLAFASTCTKFSSMLGKVVSQSPTAGTSYTLLNAPTITIYIAQFLNPVCGS